MREYLGTYLVPHTMDFAINHKIWVIEIRITLDFDHEPGQKPSVILSGKSGRIEAIHLTPNLCQTDQLAYTVKMEVSSWSGLLEGRVGYESASNADEVDQIIGEVLADIGKDE